MYEVERIISISPTRGVSVKQVPLTKEIDLLFKAGKFVGKQPIVAPEPPVPHRVIKEKWYEKLAKKVASKITVTLLASMGIAALGSLLLAMNIGEGFFFIFLGVVAAFVKSPEEY